MYRFMEQQESHAKAKWAPIPGVSKSGYYAWLETRKERQARDQTREKKVFEKGNHPLAFLPNQRGKQVEGV